MYMHNMYIYIWICMYVCMYACMYVYISMYIYRYTHIYEDISEDQDRVYHAIVVPDGLEIHTFFCLAIDAWQCVLVVV